MHVNYDVYLSWNVKNDSLELVAVKCSFRDEE